VPVKELDIESVLRHACMIIEQLATLPASPFDTTRTIFQIESRAISHFA
jgi:hypothetical protein